MQFLKIPVRRTVETFVIVAIPKGEPTEHDIEAAVAKTTEPQEWDEIPGTFEHDPPVPMDKTAAEEYHVHFVGGETTGRPTFKARAERIGVTVLTLRKWRDEHGVDVWSDDDVRRHIGRQRNHSWSISSDFKAKLSS